MRFFVGTSGFSYKGWKGNFYPEKIPAREMLRFYAGKLTGVEINNTFYRMPKVSVLESWRQQVPEGFRFAVKASRRITHFKRLQNADEETGYLLEVVQSLGPQLGVVLFQLPPNFQKDLVRLETFLELLPTGTCAAFEFRHRSWWDDDVSDCLRSSGCALCLADTDNGPADPIVATSTTGYLRLRRTAYTDQELGEWARRVGDQGWEEAYVFFKHEEAGAGPHMAARFLQLVG